MSFLDVRMKELLPTVVSSLDLISLESIHKFLRDGELQVNFESGLPYIYAQKFICLHTFYLKYFQI